MIQLMLLEVDDPIQPDDWCRPTDLRPESDWSDNYGTRGRGGHPINNQKWVPFRQIFARIWHGKTHRELIKAGIDPAFEFVRGPMPKTHQLDLSEYNVLEPKLAEPHCIHDWLHTLTFGQYKGATLNTVLRSNPSYLLWAHDNVKGFKLGKSLLNTVENYTLVSHNRATENIDYDDDVEDFLRPF